MVSIEELLASIARKRKLTEQILSRKTGEHGPTYGVALIESLPLKGGFTQAMPSRGDLVRAVESGHERLADAYEVLLAHYHDLMEGDR